jgi:diaminopimelate decarboxylase
MIAGNLGKNVKVSFRVNPALEVPTHPKIATGLATSKFGIPTARSRMRTRQHWHAAL